MYTKCIKCNEVYDLNCPRMHCLVNWLVCWGHCCSNVWWCSIYRSCISQQTSTANSANYKSFTVNQSAKINPPLWIKALPLYQGWGEKNLCLVFHTVSAFNSLSQTTTSMPSFDVQNLSYKQHNFLLISRPPIITDIPCIKQDSLHKEQTHNHCVPELSTDLLMSVKRPWLLWIYDTLHHASLCCTS